VCEAPTDDELRGEIYSPQVLSRLSSLVSLASSKVAEGSIEARRIALFRREYLDPLCVRFPVRTSVRIGLLADIHIGDDNDNSDLKRALRIFDAKKADAVIAAGDLTDFGLLSELKEVAAAWNEVFPGSRRSDGEPVVRLFHYGDHDTALNFKVRQREVIEQGRWADYIPHVGPDVAWERAFGEKFEPVVRRTVKGCEFTLVHFLPSPVPFASSVPSVPVGRKPWLHVFSQHRAYRGLFARPGCGDEVSWDDGASLAFLTNTPNTVVVCGHAHISATNATSFVAGGGRGATALPDGFAAIAIPSLF
jgi:predicted phosphodiesterase